VKPRDGRRPPLVAKGDRFRIREPYTATVLIVARAPAHTQSVESELPAGTIVVANQPQLEATGFSARPEDYERLERILVPEPLRTSGKYHSYYLVFRFSDIGTLIEPVG
jgi:hypothetical protein